MNAASDAGSDSHDRLLERFEHAWISGELPQVSEFVDNSLSPDDHLRVIADLVEIDLEFRWKRYSDRSSLPQSESTDEPRAASEIPDFPHLSDYVIFFTDLPGDDSVAERLLLAEYRVRHKWGDQPSKASFLEQNQVVIGKALESRIADALHAPSADVQSGQSEVRERSERLGPYKILQKIAEGGMGAVYMAEQDEPVRRRVALKVIKAGADSAQIIARFEAERQALAMMDHPNIAKIFDGGTSDQGAPYFVMELVKGIPLTEYCDKNKLSIRERIELFVPVCKAVQHAHLQGIIHRDLKPSNVLVALYDGVPVPKIIDFGLAKATQHQARLTDRTIFTEFGQIVGTLQYMSPEQAELNQLDVDTRTDVYSLGVMLYELLVGSPPLDRATMGQNALLQVLQLIRDHEPPSPSTRLSQSGDAIAGVSEQRKIEPGRLQQVLRGELDWIVMRSLEKDRCRRYESANAFGNDLARFLKDEVVHARPPSLGYRLRKTVRRHRSAVRTCLVTVIIALLVFLWWPSGARSTEELLFDSQNVAESRMRSIALLEYIKQQREATGNDPLYAPINSSDCRGKVDLHRAQLQDVTVGYDEDLKRLCLFEADMRRVGMSNCYFGNTVFSGSDLTEATLNGSDFTNAVFASSRLAYTNLHNANFRDADLSGADFTGARLEGACLADVRNWNGVDLTDANLERAIVEDGRWIEKVKSGLSNPNALDRWQVVKILPGTELPDQRYYKYAYWIQKLPN